MQPASELVDGQSVQVSGTGFTGSAQVAIGECQSGATTSSDCSATGALVITAAADGTFSTSFIVSREFTIGASSIDCSNPGACVVGAGQLPTLSTFATAPIGFAAVTPPTPSPGTPSSRYYLALGDSLATGFGAPARQGYVNDLAAYYGSAI
ncbi:MAG: neocarzinostatin apoprotein domain-containing protein, partial [Acidimicrobiales bacterium]